MNLWRPVTIVLVAFLVGLSAWIYRRDVGPYAPQRSEQAQAGRDADLVLGLMTPSRACAGGCTADLIDRSAPDVWRMRLAAPDWQRCFALSVNTFSATEQHGVTGVRSVSCD